MKNYYSILEISASASIGSIKTAYRKLAKIWHPDLHKDCKQAEGWFREVQEAYETLSNSARKSLYDRHYQQALRGAKLHTPTKPRLSQVQEKISKAFDLEEYQARLAKLHQKHQALVEEQKKQAAYQREKSAKTKDFYTTFCENRAKSFSKSKQQPRVQAVPISPEQFARILYQCDMD